MFVGRPAELAQIDDLLAEATGGHGRVLWLTGDPGIGKSALLDAAARRSRRRGVQVALVHAVPLSEPYGLVADLLRTLGTPSVTPPLDHASASAALVPALSGFVARAPSLVAIDDLPSADEGSVAGVVAALSRTTDLPLAVLITGREPRLPIASRDDGSAPWHRWPQRRLDALDTRAATALAREILGPEAPERTVDALVTASCHHPGAICDAARLLTPDELYGITPLPDPLPMSPSMSRAWISSLETLSDASRRALTVLAVVKPTRFDLMARVLEASGCEVAALDEALDRGILRHGSHGVIEFVQLLLETAIVVATPPALCRELHRTAGTAAEDLQLETAVIVGHLAASTAQPDASVAARLEAQAQRSRREGDVHAAAEAQVWAARLTPDAKRRRTRILKAVRDRAVCINSPEAVQDLLHLLGPDPVPSEISAWVTALRASVEPNLALAAAENSLAIDQARAHAPELLPEMLWRAATSYWAMGQPEPAMTATNDFVRAMEAVPDCPDIPSHAGIALRAVGLFQRGAVEESTPARAAALEAADDLDVATCPVMTLLNAVELDDLLLADTAGSRTRMSAALMRCAPETPQTPCLWGIAAWQARARGDWVSAQLLINDGLEVCHELSAVVPLQGLLAVSVELAALQGDENRLVRHGRALRDLGIWTADRRRLAILDRASGMAALAAGSLESAAASFVQAADVPFLGRGLRDAVIPSRVDLVEVLHRLDRHDEAGRRADALHGILRAMDQPLARAWDERVSALVSPGQEADAHYEAALSAHECDVDPFEHGRTELLYGEHLRRTQRRSRAREHLARAETLFARMHAEPWLELARQELRVAGTARRTGSSLLPTLTGQEANIATAVAQGCTTREVADLFVLSPRTVETHLSSVYRKLGLTGRAGLARALEVRRD